MRIGDVAVIAGEPLELLGERVVSRAMDNRLGAFIALEAARLVAEAGGAPGDVAACGVVQEEITLAGARTSAYSLDPDVAIVVDVTHETGLPRRRGQRDRHAQFGDGPVIGRGSTLNPAVFELPLRDRAARGHPVHDRGLGARRPAPTPTPSTSRAPASRPAASRSRCATCTRRSRWWRSTTSTRCARLIAAFALSLERRDLVRALKARSPLQESARWFRRGATRADGDGGLVPAGRGLVRAERARRALARGRTSGPTPASRASRASPSSGINIGVLQPGQPACMYHGEDDQEDFLVLAGECLLLIEGQERRAAGLGLRSLPGLDRARLRRRRRRALRDPRRRRAAGHRRRLPGHRARPAPRRRRRRGDPRRRATPTPASARRARAATAPAGCPTDGPPRGEHRRLRAVLGYLRVRQPGLAVGARRARRGAASRCRRRAPARPASDRRPAESDGRTRCRPPATGRSAACALREPEASSRS